MSSEFAQAVTGYEMVESVGRNGVCWDSSVAGSFFSSGSQTMTVPATGPIVRILSMQLKRAVALEVSEGDPLE